MSVPTRTEIFDKIGEIRHDPAFSSIQSDLDGRIEVWLTSLSCPAEDRAKILDDLGSYENY